MAGRSAIAATRRLDDGSNDAQRPARKPRRARGKWGRLQGMPDMPLDILLEIMSHLMPMDLLNLSRSTRSLRGLLMHRSAAPFWKAARKNVTAFFPECPADLSEPEYASLAFEPRCHGCGRPGAKTVLWALRVRYCPSCRDSYLTWCPTHRASPFTDSCDDMVLPFTRDQVTKGHWHLTSSVIRMTEVFDEMDDEALAAQKRSVGEIMEHAWACKRWQDGSAFRRKQEVNKIRNQRLHDTVARLRDLGWDDLLNKMAPNYKALRKQPVMKEAKDITDRTWPNIQAIMEEVMVEEQRRRDEGTANP